jgi:cytidylate kinase
MMMENENKIYTAPRILIRLAVPVVKIFLFTYLSARWKRITERETTKQQENVSRATQTYSLLYFYIKAQSGCPEDGFWTG